mmetsp:Transcript_6959/g.10370  ORF Transcript_6959/g.10370 Transcript_6959/m.10370 type:complete len:413 (+) Transcript_6959:98-1336(+)
MNKEDSFASSGVDVEASSVEISKEKDVELVVQVKKYVSPTESRDWFCTKQLQGTQRGIVIALTGILLVTPDSMLVRWASFLGAPGVTVLGWKLIFGGFWTGIATLIFTENWYQDLQDQPRSSALVGFLLVAVSIGISFGVLLSFAANAILLFSIDPVWSAIFGYFLFGDALPRSTLFTIIASFIATIIMFMPIIINSSNNNRYSTLNLFGDLISLAAGILLAIDITFLRYKFMTGNSINAIAATAIANIIGGGLCLALGCATGSHIFPKSKFFFLISCFDGIAITAAICGNSFAPRYLTAPHIGLLSLLETILGPLWVYLRFREVPFITTFIGGAILLIAIGSHEIIEIRKSRHLTPLVTYDDDGNIPKAAVETATSLSSPSSSFAAAAAAAAEKEQVPAAVDMEEDKIEER